MSRTEFGAYLKSLRGTRTLRHMEKTIGLSHTFLISLERGIDPRSGNERWPSNESLRKISVAYGVPFIELLIKSGQLTESEVREWRLAKHSDRT